jgi:hypothetical protein
VLDAKEEMELLWDVVMKRKESVEPGNAHALGRLWW